MVLDNNIIQVMMSSNHASHLNTQTLPSKAQPHWAVIIIWQRRGPLLGNDNPLVVVGITD